MLWERQRPCCRRCQRVFFSNFLCFFFLMRLRRFLIREPMAGGDTRRRGVCCRIAGAGCRPGKVLCQIRSACLSSKVSTSFGGGVTAARGPLESQVEVRNLAPEPWNQCLAVCLSGSCNVRPPGANS